MSSRLRRLSLLAALVSLPVSASAIGTAAGSSILNTASAAFTDSGGVAQTVSSNTSSIQVDEILDVTLTVNNAGNVAVTSPDTDRALSFTLTNIGNGPEAYALSTNSAVAGDQFDPANTRIYLDNGDGVFNAATDTLYVAGSNDPLLQADTALVVFVVSDMPAGHASGETAQVSLSAESRTAQATAGADAPGTVFPGQGSNGSTAVVGSSQADATVQNGYVISQVATSLTKSSSVLDSFGGSNAIPGAVITYTLVFAANGSGSLGGTLITDPIPAGTTYVPGSLTLGGVALTDASDADAGRFTGTGVEVLLGTVSAPATRTVTFKVTIN